MPHSNDVRTPTPAGRQLGAVLRGLREETELSGDAVASKLGWSSSKVSRFERARTCIRPGDVELLLRLYKVPPHRAQALLEVARKSWAEAGQLEVARFEVTEVRAWAPLTVPLLLQTEEYQVAVLAKTGAITPVSPGMVRNAVNRNVLWQDRLLAEDSPLRLLAVLDESVLRRRFGSPADMAAQLRRLQKRSELAHVDLRVLPLDGGGPSHLPPFTYTVFSSPVDDLQPAEEVQVPTMGSPWQPEGERDIWLHSLALGQLADAAEPAADYLKKALADWA